MKKIVISIATTAVVGLMVFNLSLTTINGNGNISLSTLFNIAKADIEIGNIDLGGSGSGSGSDTGLTCTSTNDCSPGHSADVDSHGKVLSCCGEDTPKLRGHYHS